jgi:hypothetical protein
VQHSKIGRRKVEMGQTRSLQRCPLHDRSSTESGSPSAILLCRTSANSGCEHSQQDSPYSITSSARASSEGGTVSPSILAALRVDDQFKLAGLN